MNTVQHFRNFLGRPGTTLCGLDRIPDDVSTLDPAKVNCEHCLARLGRLRDAQVAPPSLKKPRE